MDIGAQKGSGFVPKYNNQNLVEEFGLKVGDIVEYKESFTAYSPLQIRLAV